MQAPSAQDLIKRLHDSPDQLVMTLTGGGSRAISDLLEVPGASRTLLWANVPYSLEALQDFLREWDEDLGCEESTARRLAVESFDIAFELADPENPAHGIGCTASLASDREKRGPHRVHVAAQTAQRTACYSLVLEKGARSRAEEERVAANLVLDAAAEAAGLPGGLTGPLLRESEKVERHIQVALPEWPTMGSDVAWRAGMPQQSESPTEPPRLVFPGAFNPLHQGHQEMAAVAERMTGERVTYELSMENVEKPPLDYVEIARRLEQFGDRPCLVTRAPTFVEKASLMPGCTFIVGIDTLVRIADEDYYDESESVRDAAIAQIADTGCRFLVFGRAFDEEFITLEDLGVPPELAALCTGVPESEFRVDVSSTQLREGC